MVRNIRVHTVTTFEWGSPERSHCADSIFVCVTLIFCTAFQYARSPDMTRKTAQ